MFAIFAYAQVAFALAMVYRNLGDFAEYRKWLVTAAIADQINSLKENLALQTLAMSVRYEDGDVDKAYKYLKLALEDAVAFNNRLRILEIARIIPEIIGEYQKSLEERNNALNFSLLAVTFLVICLIIAIMLVIKQRRETENTKVWT